MWEFFKEVGRKLNAVAAADRHDADRGFDERGVSGHAAAAVELEETRNLDGNEKPVQQGTKTAKRGLANVLSNLLGDHPSATPLQGISPLMKSSDRWEALQTRSAQPLAAIVSISHTAAWLEGLRRWRCFALAMG